MRILAFLSVALLLPAHTAIRGTQSEPRGVHHTRTHTREERKASTDSVVQYLVTAAATDFHAHGPSGNLRFRKVRFGHVTGPGAEKQYRLCGQFLPSRQGAKSQWTLFVTIKTSGYEQYIGRQASNFCQDSTIIWDNVGDLSSSLQSRFDALTK